MRNGTLLWDAMGMIGEDLLEEAVKGEKQMAKRYGKRVWILAAAGILLLSLLGWAAKEWIFAPGFGIIPTYTDMGVTVYATEERVQIGQYTLEGAVFTENEAEPAENSLMFWLYCEDQEAFSVWPDIWVNGNLYAFRYFRMTQNSNLACYTYAPDTGREMKPEGVGPAQTIAYPAAGEEGGLPVVTVQAVTGMPPYDTIPVGEPVHIALAEPESGTIEQVWLDAERYVSFLSLTDNVVMANLHDPAVLSCTEGIWDISARGNGTILYADGSTSSVSGYLSMDDASPKKVTGMVSERYDVPISSITLDSVSVNMDYMLRKPEDVPAFTCSFPLMEVGETLPMEERMWSGMGVELWLTAVTRTEHGLEGVTELRNLAGEMLMASGEAGCMFYAGEGIDRGGYVSDEHPLIQRECITENGMLYAGRNLKPGGSIYALTMETGDPVVLALREVTITYGKEDGSPLGEIDFPQAP